MEFFQRAKVFRLKSSHHSKYLTADEDEHTIKQARNRASNKAQWAYEPIEGKPNKILLRSIYSHRYLSATEDPFLLGMTGKKVTQTIVKGQNLEWEPIKDGPYIKLKSYKGSLLRANSGVPPWRNSITHDEAGNWTGRDSMVLWIVDIVEIAYDSKHNSVVSSLPNDIDHKSQTQHSDSLDNHKTMSTSVEDEQYYTDEESVSEYSHESTTSDQIHRAKVEMAKHTLKEMQDLDFHIILLPETNQKLTDALKVLIETSSQENISIDLINFEERLLDLKNKHESASQDLVECTNFTTRRSNLMAELKKDATKARELETLQAESKIARARKDELLKQIGEIDIVIRDVEKSQAENMTEVEEIISRIGQKSQKLEEMRIEEELWQVRISDARRMLEKVEEDWVKVKENFPDD